MARPRELNNVRVLAAASAMTVTVVAWGVLVFAAIDFGRTARAGENNGWLHLTLATVGAVACMFGAIVVAAQMQQLMRVPQHSSTRPLAQPLSALGPLPEPGEVLAGPLAAPSPVVSSAMSSGPVTTTYPSGGGTPTSQPAPPQPAPQPALPGKRAAR